MILYSISYSPWSLRVKWVVKHHRIDLDEREYMPMAMVPMMRWKLRDFSGKITMPLLLDGDAAFRDSTDIARHLDPQGSGPSLFADDAEVIDAWTATADDIADAGRVVTTYTVMQSPAARRDSIPPQIPKSMRSVAMPIVDVGIKYLASKYEFTEADVEPARARMRAGLERIANRLVDHDHLGDQFGWSDIVVASALQFVKPANGWVRQGKAAVECWTRPELADEFGDVLTWRDRLLDTHGITRK